MKIPKSLQLGGRTIKVEYNDKVRHSDSAVGLAIFRLHKIELQPTTKEHPIIKSELEQTYCHELVHWILYSMGKHELTRDEEFVDLFGTFLHQALSTSKYS